MLKITTDIAWHLPYNMLQNAYVLQGQTVGYVISLEYSMYMDSGITT